MKKLVHKIIDKKKFKAIFQTFLILFIILILINFIRYNFIIGLDFQNVRSLPFKFYVIKKSNYIAFYSDERMTRYFPVKSIFIKKVIARAGDVINTVGRKFYVNGKYIGEALQYDLDGNPINFYKFKNYKLKPGEYFVLGTNKYSYDSRYWGLVYENQIIGKVFPIF